MTTFLQLHILTTYAASNLNRDDTGRPKTLSFGGVDRLRVSSQSLKRAFRTSDVFCEAVGGGPGLTTGHVATRTQNLVTRMVDQLKSAGKSDEEALQLVLRALAKAKSKAGDEDDEEGEDEKPTKGKSKGKKDAQKLTVGSLNKEKGRETETNELVSLSPDELARADAIAAKLAKGETVEQKDAVVLVHKPRAADMALFGRMLADNPTYNVEAAAQVAHAFTTHKVGVEDDFFTAVDDLTNDRGAGFIGVGEYGAGIFYLYVCVDADQLVRNLSGDKKLAGDTAEAFVEAIATVSPKGKQNSFASRAYASFALGEVGSRSPRSLAAAFVEPVGAKGENDFDGASKEKLKKLRAGFDGAYGKCWTKDHIIDVAAGQGSLAELKTLAREAIDAVKL
jgi:CRISPR system Cascade subunit CasC